MLPGHPSVGSLPKMSFGMRLTFPAVLAYFSFEFEWPARYRTFFAVLSSFPFPLIRTDSNSYGSFLLDFDNLDDLLFPWTFFCLSLTFGLAKKFSVITFLEWFFGAFLNFISPFSFEKFHNFSFNFRFFIFPFETPLPWFCFCRCSVVFIVLRRNGCNTDDRRDPFGFRADFCN